MATAQGNTARQDQAVNQQRALAECPLSGQTGHAGMARMTLMTQLPLQLAHSDASRQRKHCGRFQSEADIDCGLQKKKADLLVHALAAELFLSEVKRYRGSAQLRHDLERVISAA
jgi:hypothetical protein